MDRVPTDSQVDAVESVVLRFFPARVAVQMKGRILAELQTRKPSINKISLQHPRQSSGSSDLPPSQVVQCPITLQFYSPELEQTFEAFWLQQTWWALFHTLLALLAFLPSALMVASACEAPYTMCSAAPIVIALVQSMVLVVFLFSMMPPMARNIYQSIHVRFITAMLASWPGLLPWRYLHPGWYCLVALNVLAPLPHKLNLPLQGFQLAIVTLAQNAAAGPGHLDQKQLGLTNTLLASLGVALWFLFERRMRRLFLQRKHREA